MKSLSISIISIATLGLLSITNPKMADYDQFIHTKIIKESEKGDGLSKGILVLFGGFASSLITNATSRDDYIFISIFETTLGDNHIKSIGILNNFIVLSHPDFGRTNQEQLPANNISLQTPISPPIKKPSHIDFIPALAGEWPPINNNAYISQTPFDLCGDELSIDACQTVGKLPLNVVQNSDRQRFIQLLGKDFEEFAKFISVSDGEWRVRNAFVVEGCMSHSCSNKHGIIVINAKTGHAYAGVIDDDKVKVWGGDNAKDLPDQISTWLVKNGIKME